MQITLNNQTLDEEAIQLIQAIVEDNTAFVGLSGGKDSTVVEDLVKRSTVKAEYHYHRTGLDAPETIKFIRETYPNCVFDIPDRTFWQGAMSNGFPLRRQRWCCAELKECFGRGRIIVDGVRCGESNQRKARKCFEPAINDPATFFLHPIFKWSTSDVWQYIDERHLPHNPLYYSNGKRVPSRRIGCILCPFTTQQECHRQMVLFPGFVKLYRYYAEQYIRVRIDRGTPLTQKTGDEYFEWWLSMHEGGKRNIGIKFQ